MKVTLSLDKKTVARLQEASQRLAKSKSQIVREAVCAHCPPTARLSEAERRRLLRLLEEHLARPAQRSQAETDRELREIRLARRRGWRRYA